MCGIVAIISKTPIGFNYKDGDMFKQMLYANALRGFDSTGIFGINKYNNLQMIKAAQPAATFLETKAFSDFKSDMFSRLKVVVGHNRAATKGATTDTNAHPFIEDHICLIHNGTITGHKDLADTDVDSHAICHAFAKDGHMETIPKINGAYALIWYDAKEKLLHIARNEQRPLWLIQTDAADYIASEPEMLVWLLRRVHNVVGKPVYFATDMIYSYDMTKLSTGYKTTEKPKKAQPVSVAPSKLTQVSKKVRKAMKIGKQKSNNITTASEVSSTDMPAFGDTVFFQYDNSVVQNNTVRIEGKTLADNNKVAAGFLDVSKYTAAQLEHHLEYTTEFYGSYRGFSKKRDGTIQLFVDNLHPVNEYLTLTGILINDRQLAKAGNCCYECGEILDPAEQENEFWVRVNQAGIIKDMLCPTCVTQHPHLSILLEKKCTNVSSSSDTKLDQLQSNC